jgi:predicted nucleotidyltransferase component of viral defense system
MEEVGFNPFQKAVFHKISQEKYFQKNFYFSGGTALSAFYLHHRYSFDLDFFSPSKLDYNQIIKLINKISKELNLSVKITKKEMVLWFELQKEKETLKIDFLEFPYPQIDKGLTYQGIKVDSIKDIGANKLLILNLNEEPKDYVDLYFILKEKYLIWDLIETVRLKFNLGLDLISLGDDFLKAGKIKFLPQMIKPLTLNELRSFFRQQARKIGKKIT